MFAFPNHILRKKRDNLQLLLSFAIQSKAPLVNPIITVLLFCYFIFVAIITLSTNSAIPSTASFFRFRISIKSLFSGEGVTKFGSRIFFCTLSNTNHHIFEMNNIPRAFYHVASSTLITLLRYSAFELLFLLSIKKRQNLISANCIIVVLSLYNIFKNLTKVRFRS